MFDNYAGGAYEAPPYLNANMDDPNLWAANAGIDPLIIIGIGDYGESLLLKFKAFTKFYRSGFSWSQDSLLSLIISETPNTYQIERSFLKISLDRDEDIQRVVNRFLIQGNYRCVIALDLTNRGTFSIARDLLFLLDEIRAQRSIDFPVEIIASVDKNLTQGQLGYQSARIRTLSIWQQQGRHRPGRRREIALLDNAFLLKKDVNYEVTINKSVLGLYSICHSTRHLHQLINQRFQGNKTFAIDLRAVFVPYQKLIEYKAIELTKSILFDEENLFSQNDRQFDDVVGQLVKDLEVIQTYHRLNRTPDQEKKIFLRNLMNSPNDPYKWEKAHLLAHWFRFGIIKDFAKRIGNISPLLFNELGDRTRSVLNLLNQMNQDPVLRSTVAGNVNEIQVALAPLFSKTQIDDIKKDVLGRLSFETNEFEAWLSFDHNEDDRQNPCRIMFNSNDGQVEGFLDKLISYVYSRLESTCILSLQTPLFNMVINHDAARYLEQIPDAIPGIENNHKIYLSSPNYIPQEIYNPLIGLQRGSIAEPGLALVVLVESGVDHKSYPTNTLYQAQHIEDERMHNSYSLERNWAGQLVYEFSPKTLVYMANLRAVKLFFEALILGAVEYDIYQEAWFISGFHPANEKIRLANQDVDVNDSLESLVNAFQYFTLDGIAHEFGTHPFSTIERHANSLNLLEKYLAQLDREPLPVDRLPGQAYKLPNAQQAALQSDFIHLYNHYYYQLNEE